MHRRAPRSRFDRSWCFVFHTLEVTLQGCETWPRRDGELSQLVDRFQNRVTWQYVSKAQGPRRARNIFSGPCAYKGNKRSPFLQNVGADRV